MCEPSLVFPGPDYPWKMVSIYSPWIQLIMDGHKPLENRPGRTAKQFTPGMWVALHNSKTQSRIHGQPVHIPARYCRPRPWRHGGHILGVARVLDVLPASAAQEYSEYRPWVSTGENVQQFCIIWDVVVRFDEPIRVIGGQGLPKLYKSLTHYRNHQGELKSPMQILRSRTIAGQRRRAVASIHQRLDARSFTITRSADCL